MSNFEQAIKWLEEGKGIKRTNWRIDGEVHLILKDGEVFDSYGKEYKFEYDDIKTKKWMVYKKKYVNDNSDENNSHLPKVLCVKGKEARRYSSERLSEFTNRLVEPSGDTNDLCECDCHIHVGGSGKPCPQCKEEKCWSKDAEQNKGCGKKLGIYECGKYCKICRTIHLCDECVKQNKGVQSGKNI